MDNSLQATTAVVFPGMGPTSFADVGRFMLVNPYARELVAEADEVLGYPLVERYREASGNYSEYAQVAFMVNSVALARWAEANLGMTAGVCAGPSFGGKAAMAYSGALSFADAVRLTAGMARALDEYFAVEHRDVVTHSFIRTPEDRLREILAELDEAGEWHEVACVLDEGFQMMSLHRGRSEWLENRLRAVGGLPLFTMHPPLHASVFGALRDRIESELLGGLTFADPRLPVVADQDGTVRTTGEGVRRMLLDGVVQPVRWPEVVASLQRLGVGTMYVCGQDSLFGRVGVTTRNFELHRVDVRTAMQPRRRTVNV
ncbi:ACP S-malonyltransferase [Actinoplanes subglobosus]|uniref:[acyl-carrier-protein] S-malonyltransferase n=1 Tax=Actinoplanes subglobosus TaxID=1547892 RepID=A0ABV8IXL1_9ACTN